MRPRRKSERARSVALARAARAACAVGLCVLLIGGCRRQDAATATHLPKITTKTGRVMLLVPAGQFVMGDDAGRADERPARAVRVASFYMDAHEVTQKDFQLVMGRNPSKFKGPDLPVERASWLGAVQYCNARSLREGLKPCYDARTLRCDFDADGYRLPTEAEWEYACRAGTTGAYSFGADGAALGRFGWYQANSNRTTHPVGRKQANPWGFFDMHGNVSEWCGDYYGAESYGSGGPDNPRGPAAGEERVLRGGSWRDGPEACRSAGRASEEPGFADVCFGYEAYGFRCVRKAPPAAGAAK